MGNCLHNHPSYHNIETKDTTNDQAVDKCKKIQQIKYKILLLGAGMEGKSTIFKQFKKLHGRQFSRNELLAIKPALGQNVIEAMRTLAIFADIFSNTGIDSSHTIHWTSVLISGYLRKEAHCYLPQSIKQLFLSYLNGLNGYGHLKIQNIEIRNRVAAMNDKQKFTESHYNDFKQLWNDPFIKQIVEQRHKFQLNDSAEYLFSKMNCYWRDDYIPTFDDMIHSYRRTVACHRTKFCLTNKRGEYEEIYEIWDTGGQRNERRKWVHYFDNTTAIIYVVAISAYNQLLWEDNQTNRMREAIGLFCGIVNLNIFDKTPIIVFFNKYDLFLKKVAIFPVKEYFKDFKGNEVADEIIDYFKQKFREQIVAITPVTPQSSVANNNVQDNQCKKIYFHITCATDTLCIKKTFELCRDVIVETEFEFQELV